MLLSSSAPPVGFSKFGVNPLNAKVDPPIPPAENLSLSAPPVIAKVIELPLSTSVAPRVPITVCSSAILLNEVVVITGASLALITAIV